MIRKTVWLASIVTLATATAWAQEPRVEVSATAGWTFSDGVSGEAFRAPDGNLYDRIDPKDSFSWGAQIGFLVSENVEVGFLFNQQQSKLVLGGQATREIGDQSIYNYHGYVAYNFGYGDSTVRPYLMGGLGATQYASFGFTGADGEQREIDGSTRFSTTWGAGVKVFPSPSFGIRAGVRWTPTYIKSDAAGWWCDPYWGCWVVGDAQYSNQWELAGGVTLRF